MENKIAILRPVKLEFVSLEEGSHGGHLIVEVVINGKPARMVVDTGASHSSICISRREMFDLQKIPGESQVIGLDSEKLQQQAVVGSIQIGDFVIEAIPVLLLDLYGINRSYYDRGHKMIDGLLGSDALNIMDALIDYKGMHLISQRRIELKDDVTEEAVGYVEPEERFVGYSQRIEETTDKAGVFSMSRTEGATAEYLNGQARGFGIAEAKRVDMLFRADPEKGPVPIIDPSKAEVCEIGPDSHKNGDKYAATFPDKSIHKGDEWVIKAESEIADIENEIKEQHKE